MPGIGRLPRTGWFSAPRARFYRWLELRSWSAELHPRIATLAKRRRIRHGTFVQWTFDHSAHLRTGRKGILLDSLAIPKDPLPNRSPC